MYSWVSKLTLLCRNQLYTEFVYRTSVILCSSQSSCLQSVSIGWDGGVYVQTCGHTLHIDCHKSYMESLRVSELKQYYLSA